MPNLSGQQPIVPFDATGKGFRVIASDIVSMRAIITIIRDVEWTLTVKG